MQHAIRKLIGRQVLRTKTQNVGVGNRACADTDHVAHDAADTGVGAAERLQRRGVVVGLDFERQVVVVVEGDDTGVVDEGRAHPGLVGPLGGRADVGLEQRVDLLLVHVAVGVDLAVVDQRAEGLVDAVLGPRLRQRLQLDIGRLAAFLAVVILNRLHLGQIEGKPSLQADRE